MEEKQSSTEDNIERSMEPCGSRNSFIQSLRVAQELILKYFNYLRIELFKEIP